MNDSVVKEDKYENYLLVEGNDDKHVLSHHNQISGALEDFVRFLVPSDDVLWPKAKNIVEEVKAIETDRRLHNVYESKACIHTWLAWQKEPGKPMGVAITARYLDATTSHAQQLITWIRQLFDLESA